MFKKIFLSPLISLFITLVIWVLYTLEYSFEGLYDFLGEESSKITIEILVTILLPTSIVLIINLLNFVFKLRKIEIDKTIEPIQSSKIKKIGYGFIKDSIDKISNKFSTMLSGDRSMNVLWELEQLELAELEIGGVGIDYINEKVKRFRRNRITSIANGLIHKKGIFKSNVEYFTTETRRPSKFEEIDSRTGGFRDDQLEFLKKYKPKRSHRILILQKDELIYENSNERASLIDFINWNNQPYDSDKSTILNIISFDQKIEDVFFNCAVNEFYDFAISKKNSSITVFAQKDKITTLYDSEKTTNKNIAESFYKCYSRLINCCETNKNKKIRNIYYSGIIKNETDLDNFINILT